MSRSQLVTPTSSENSKLHEKDFYGWAMRSAELVRQGRFEEIDRESLAEEIEDMGKSERRELINLLGQSFAHIIKHDYLSPTHPNNTTKWRKEAESLFKQAMDVLAENPSLKNELSKIFEKGWERGRGEVYRAFNQFEREKDLDKLGVPQRCPWSNEKILSGEILPATPTGIRRNELER